MCIISVLVVILLGVYLNRSYAFMYKKIEQAALLTPSDFGSYVVGDQSSKPVSYVALGDSFTAGVGVETYTKSYPYIVSQRISENNKKVELTPFAVPGARTQYILTQLLDSTIKKNPDIITVFIGVNDVHGNISIDDFKDSYTKIIERLTQETDAQIFVINLPYVGTKELIRIPYRQYFDTRTQKFNEVIKELAQEYDIGYIDLYTAQSPNSLNELYYSADLFHPGQIGYASWAQIIYENLNR